MDDNLLTIGQTAKILGVSIDTLRRWDKNGKFSSVRVHPGGNRYYRKSDVDLFIKDPFAMAKKWAASASVYEPEPKYYCKTRDVFQARLEHFQSELSGAADDAFFSLVSAIAGEIGNNSFDHNLGNWPDIVGIYFSYSLAQKKIVLADRGLGILFTLRKVKPDLKSHQEALEVAFTQTISGRAPESRGNGLKFVRDVVINNPINLTFQTGNAFLDLGQDKKYLKIATKDDSIRGCLAVINFR
ncbi:MAG: MerR family transcriptional regulator [bacterium]|nr:MerR family transcriptional regulator [bacterium]